MNIDIHTGNTPNIDFKNPFLKNKFKNMHLHVMENTFDKGVFNISGSIEFVNGQTEGKQKFIGESIDDILKKMKEFVDNLK